MSTTTYTANTCVVHETKEEKYQLVDNPEEEELDLTLDDEQEEQLDPEYDSFWDHFTGLQNIFTPLPDLIPVPKESSPALNNTRIYIGRTPPISKFGIDSDFLSQLKEFHHAKKIIVSAHLSDGETTSGWLPIELLHADNAPRDVVRFAYPLQDHTMQELGTQTLATFAATEKYLQSLYQYISNSEVKGDPKNILYFHCKSGKSRGTCMLAQFLMAYSGMSAYDAMRYIAERHPGTRFFHRYTDAQNNQHTKFNNQFIGYLGCRFVLNLAKGFDLYAREIEYNTKSIEPNYQLSLQKFIEQLNSVNTNNAKDSKDSKETKNTNSQQLQLQTILLNNFRPILSADFGRMQLSDYEQFRDSLSKINQQLKEKYQKDLLEILLEKYHSLNTLEKMNLLLLLKESPDKKYNPEQAADKIKALLFTESTNIQELLQKEAEANRFKITEQQKAKFLIAFPHPHIQITYNELIQEIDEPAPLAKIAACVGYGILSPDAKQEEEIRSLIGNKKDNLSLEQNHHYRETLSKLTHEIANGTYQNIALEAEYYKFKTTTISQIIKAVADPEALAIMYYSYARLEMENKFCPNHPELFTNNIHEPILAKLRSLPSRQNLIFIKALRNLEYAKGSIKFNHTQFAEQLFGYFTPSEKLKLLQLYASYIPLRELDQIKQEEQAQRIKDFVNICNLLSPNIELPRSLQDNPLQLADLANLAYQYNNFAVNLGKITDDIYENIYNNYDPTEKIIFQIRLARTNNFLSTCSIVSSILKNGANNSTPPRPNPQITTNLLLLGNKCKEEEEAKLFTQLIQQDLLTSYAKSGGIYFSWHLPFVHWKSSYNPIAELNLEQITSSLIANKNSAAFHTVFEVLEPRLKTLTAAETFTLIKKLANQQCIGAIVLLLKNNSNKLFKLSPQQRDLIGPIYVASMTKLLQQDDPFTFSILNKMSQNQIVAFKQYFTNHSNEELVLKLTKLNKSKTNAIGTEGLRKATTNKNIAAYSQRSHSTSSAANFIASAIMTDTIPEETPESSSAQDSTQYAPKYYSTSSDSNYLATQTNPSRESSLVATQTKTPITTTPNQQSLSILVSTSSTTTAPAITSSISSTTSTNNTQNKKVTVPILSIPPQLLSQIIEVNEVDDFGKSSPLSSQRSNRISLSAAITPKTPMTPIVPEGDENSEEQESQDFNGVHSETNSGNNTARHSSMKTFAISLNLPHNNVSNTACSTNHS